MSIKAELSRLETAKSALRVAIEEKGVTVPPETKLDSYSALVDQIQIGVVVQKKQGSFTTNRSGDFTFDVGFEPDFVAIFPDQIYSEEGNYVETQNAFLFTGRNHPDFLIGALSLAPGGYYSITGFSRSGSQLSGKIYYVQFNMQTSELANRTLTYTAIKFT